MDLILVKKVQKEELTAALEKNHLLDTEVDGIRKDMQVKDEKIDGRDDQVSSLNDELIETREQLEKVVLQYQGKQIIMD